MKLFFISVLLILQKCGKLTVANTIPIPEKFDARENWPDCKSVKTISNQGQCGSSWAFASANSMSDRTCIATNGTIQINLSVEILIDCCYKCFTINGCKGGNADNAWTLWKESGIPSEQCKPYIQRETYVDQQCYPICEGNKKPYKTELVYGDSVYKLNSIEDIQRDIMENGPLALSFPMYEDFFNYTSGIYIPSTGKTSGIHTARVTGWGTENATNYWLMANSWGPNWGESGFFKIHRDFVNIQNVTVAKFKYKNDDNDNDNDDNSSESLMSNKCVFLFAVVTYVLSNCFM